MIFRGSAFAGSVGEKGLATAPGQDQHYSGAAPPMMHSPSASQSLDQVPEGKAIGGVLEEPPVAAPIFRDPPIATGRLPNNTTPESAPVAEPVAPPPPPELPPTFPTPLGPPVAPPSLPIQPPQPFAAPERAAAPPEAPPVAPPPPVDPPVAPPSPNISEFVQDAMRSLDLELTKLRLGTLHALSQVASAT